MSGTKYPKTIGDAERNEVKGATSATGSVLDLSNPLGTNYNYGAADSKDALEYTIDPNIPIEKNGHAPCLINAASEPDVILEYGVKEVASLQITAAPTTVGNVTVTLDGVATDIAIDPAVETTAIAVADKIRATAFTGWTTGGTAGTDTVTFTSDTRGVRTDAAYAEGGTGATGTMTTTTQGIDDTNATKISGATFTASTNMELWVESMDGTNVRYFFLAL